MDCILIITGRVYCCYGIISEFLEYRYCMAIHVVPDVYGDSFGSNYQSSVVFIEGEFRVYARVWRIFIIMTPYLDVFILF